MTTQNNTPKMTLKEAVEIIKHHQNYDIQFQAICIADARCSDSERLLHNKKRKYTMSEIEDLVKLAEQTIDKYSKLDV